MVWSRFAAAVTGLHVDREYVLLFIVESVVKQWITCITCLLAEQINLSLGVVRSEKSALEKGNYSHMISVLSII